MNHLARTLVLVLLIMFASSCSFGKNTRPLSELEAADLGEEVYRVRRGDLLDIQVWGEPRLSGEVYVREDGKITLALINDIEAAGKTLAELSKDIEQRLEAFVTTASVTSSVVQEAPIRYYLSGAFQKPGEYRSIGAISFLQAVATGGGFAPFADESAVILIRRGEKGDMRYELDYDEVIEGDQPNPRLRDGDVLAVK